MKSAKLGKRTSEVEVTNVSSHGFWVLIGDKERFLAFEHFPWFRDASIKDLTNIELPSPHHLYWPDLDVDIAIESIDHPERFPLVSKPPSNKPLQRRAKTRAAERRRLEASKPMGAPGILRYSRPYTLCIEALHTLCCMPGDFRERFGALDPEFLSLRDEDFPAENGIRESYVQLKRLLNRLEPKDDEGTIAGTVTRPRGAILEEAAQKLWDVHRDFTHFMNDDAS